MIDCSKKGWLMECKWRAAAAGLPGLQPSSERLVKAKSDGSLSSSATDNSSALMSRLKSKSLEPLTGQYVNCRRNILCVFMINGVSFNWSVANWTWFPVTAERFWMHQTLTLPGYYLLISRQNFNPGTPLLCCYRISGVFVFSISSSVFPSTLWYVIPYHQSNR